MPPYDFALSEIRRELARWDAAKFVCSPGLAFEQPTLEMRSYHRKGVVSTEILTPTSEILREICWHEYMADTKLHRHCAAVHPVAANLNRCNASGLSDDTRVFFPL